MSHITFDYKYALPFFKEEELYVYQDRVSNIHKQLHTRDEQVNDYKGWIDLPINYDRDEFKRIEQVAEKVKNNSDILLVIGVGGSYLGARAAIEMLHSNYASMLSKEERTHPNVIFVGHNMSTAYIQDVIDLVKDKEYSINVISKSGTTTEPAIAFRIFRKLIIEKYGEEEARKRIFVTTDKEKGALKQLATKEEYETFVIPDDIGGRYSVLTAVGLLPIAVSGIDINAMMDGTNEARTDLASSKIENNIAYQYAVIRNLLYKDGKTTEILVNYEPNMYHLAQWWQQLFGESEGKELQGIFPTYATFPTDLHSIGQYIQEGRRDLFETTIKIENKSTTLLIEEENDNLDELNYLAGKSIETINNNIFKAAIIAHVDGGVPNLMIKIPAMDAHSFGYLTYFFKKACAMSGYLSDLNPFDQPGVEMYKSNMFGLLGKPGYEKIQDRLNKRMEKSEVII